MGKRVLVAVDGNSPIEGLITYGIQLAARIDSGLAVISVSLPNDRKRSEGHQVLIEDPDRTQHGWLGHAMDESRRHSVSIDIFVAGGSLFEEVIRFVQSQPTIQFVVLAAPARKEGRHVSSFSASLRFLRSQFEGEILVVEKAGQVTTVI